MHAAAHLKIIALCLCVVVLSVVDLKSPLKNIKYVFGYVEKFRWYENFARCRNLRRIHTRLV